MFSVGIDWFRYTFEFADDFAPFLPEGYSLGEMTKPLPYYNLAFDLQPFGRIDTNTKNREQGCMVNFSGSDCRAIDETTMKTQDVVSSIAGKTRAKVTRIDLAVDAINEGVDIGLAAQYFREGKVDCRSKTCLHIKGEGSDNTLRGETLGIGKRGGLIYVRMYNKALEMLQKSGIRASEDNTEDEKNFIETLRALDHKRIEAELLGSRAVKAASALVDNDVREVAKNAIERFIRFDGLDWFDRMLNSLPSPETDLLKGERKSKGNSDKWLMEQALPSVLKAVKSGNWAVIWQLERALDEYNGIMPNVD